ncbi:MAG: acyltransferase [Prevotella sp.]|nr:acyltransferase [Prevotella sp.]
MEQVLKHRAEIYGILILWVMAFHINSACYSLSNIPLLSNFIKIGNAGVDVFLFLSGYCLYLSLNRNSNVVNFFRKRFKRVVVVYLVIAIPFFFIKMAFKAPSYLISNYLYDISGLSFWLNNCLNVWFVHAIIVFYILTIPFFHLVKKGIGYSIALLLLLYVLNIIGFLYFPLYEKAAIAYTRIPAYVLGMILADCHQRYRIQERLTVIKPIYLSLLSILLIGYLFFFLAIDGRHLILSLSYTTGLYMFYITLILPVLSLALLILKVISKIRWLSSFFATVGKVSLEFYLIHVMLILILQFQGIQHNFGFWPWIAIPLLTLPLSLAANKLSELISNKINL